MITSTSNQQVKYMKQLQKKSKLRREDKVFVVEGPKMVLETPVSHCKQIYLAESFLSAWEEKKKAKGLQNAWKDKEEVVSDHVMKAMSDTTTPQGVMAAVMQPEYSLEEILSNQPAHLLLIEGVQDPGNLGTMFRTAEGAGVTGIIMHETTVDLFHPKTVRSTMGSIYRVPFLVAKDWDETLKQISATGVELYAAHLQGKQMYDTFNYIEGCGFLIGNEGNGLTDHTAALADQYLKIPMGGELESLNAAMAAGILMYEVNRQRRL